MVMLRKKQTSLPRTNFDLDNELLLSYQTTNGNFIWNIPVGVSITKI
jgi:hypothetical protein